MTVEGERPDTVVIRRVIPAPREAVFAAWIDPKSMKHWMCPGDTVGAEAQLDPRVGGAFRIVMKGRTRDHEITGEYRIVQPPSKLAFTWISKATGGHSTLVTVELFDRGENRCELVLTHEMLPDPEAVQNHRGGWGQIVERLAEHLQRGSGAAHA